MQGLGFRGNDFRDVHTENSPVVAPVPETSQVSQSCAGMPAMTEGSVYLNDCVYEESAVVSDTSSTVICEITQLSF